MFIEILSYKKFTLNRKEIVVVKRSVCLLPCLMTNYTGKITDKTKLLWKIVAVTRKRLL